MRAEQWMRRKRLGAPIRLRRTRRSSTSELPSPTQPRPLPTFRPSAKAYASPCPVMTAVWIVVMPVPYTVDIPSTTADSSRWTVSKVVTTTFATGLTTNLTTSIPVSTLTVV